MPGGGHPPNGWFELEVLFFRRLTAECREGVTSLTDGLKGREPLWERKYISSKCF